MRGTALVALAGLLLLPVAATAAVRLVSLTSPVAAGKYVMLTVAVAPTAAVCSITVTHQGVVSTAQGLRRKRPKAGRVTWRWMVRADATPGLWQIVVDCGKAGKLRTPFVVKTNCLLDPGENPVGFGLARRDTACVLV